jgi:hypothetical protein
MGAVRTVLLSASLPDQSVDFPFRHAVESPYTPLYALPIEDDYLTTGGFYESLEDVERPSEHPRASRPASMQGIHGWSNARALRRARRV